MSTSVGAVTVYRQQGVQLSQVNLLAVQDALEDQQPPVQHLLRAAQCLQPRGESLCRLRLTRVLSIGLHNKNICIISLSNHNQKKKMLLHLACLYFLFETHHWGNFLKTFQITDDSQKKDELGLFFFCLFLSFFSDFVGRY